MSNHKEEASRYEREMEIIKAATEGPWETDSKYDPYLYGYDNFPIAHFSTNEDRDLCEHFDPIRLCELVEAERERDEWRRVAKEFYWENSNG